MYSEVMVESEETEEITSETEADTTSSDESEKAEETEAETSTEVTETTIEDVESTETSETTTEAETVTEAAENTTESENISYAQEVEEADDSTPAAEVAATDAAVVTTQAPTDPPTTTVAATTAAVSYTYKNGTYTGTAYGYDGNITAVVTIENDVITSITASSDESDTWYFEQAQGSVISQILSQQQTSVDAVSGATYSSVGIMNAVQKALNSAKN
ncbi:MAG: FMN-binding protein [Ruminococcus sp.]|nr:FMN-binding protein [Ruminococcus sp.]